MDDEPRKPTLEETYARWRRDNPVPFIYVEARPTVGFNPCAYPGCPTLIAEDQLRELCYFHGGEPNPPRDLGLYVSRRVRGLRL